MPEYNDPFHEEPGEPVGDFRPVKIPDIRKPVPLGRQALRWLVIVGLAVAVVAAFVLFRSWSERRDIERIVRDGYREQTGKQVASISLSGSGDSYSGTLTTGDGETLEVTVNVTHEHGTRMYNWQARPSLERMKAGLREDFERANQPVRSVDLRLDGKGRTTGLVTLENGEEWEVYEVTENGKPQVRFAWNQATVERWVREQAIDRHEDPLTVLELKRHELNRFSGTARGKSGLDYLVFVEPDRQNKDDLRCRIHPPVAQYERWVRAGLERGEAKVKQFSLRQLPGGDHGGRAVLTTGEAYEVRVGVPPNWRDTARDGEVTWRAAPLPESYEAWARAGLQWRYKVKIATLKLEAKGDEYDGVAVDERGRRYQVRIAPRRADEGAEAVGWPDLPDPALETGPIE